MAFGGSKRAAEEVFKPTTPHFFKILLRLDTLVIPVKFVMNYGDDLSDSVLLKVPSGSEWKVELFTSDGDVCFGNGWQEFVEHYYLVHGHLLVFEYVGNSCFNVLIFDTSATEINYPILVTGSQITTPDDGGSENNEEKERNDDDLVIILDDSDTRSHPKRKRSDDIAEFVRPRSPASVDGSEFDGMNPNSSRTSTGNRDVSSRKIRLHEAAERTRPLTHEEKEKALQIAKASFKSENPFFMIVMQPSYVKQSMLRLSLEFMKEHFQRKAGKVVLQVLGGGSWVVEYKIDKQAAFTSNWKTFTRENHLKVRDVCIFELSNATKPGFQVSIIKTSEDTIYNAPPSPEGSGP